jgi:predicted amidohydrolase
MIRVSAIQLDVGVEETTDERIARASVMVREEADAGADIVLLPEMWLRGWFDFDHYAEIGQAVDGPIGQAMSALAKDAGVLLVAGSIVERDGDQLYNTALAYDREGNRLAAYRKIHLFSYEEAREADVLSAGQDVITFEALGINIGLSICYDLRFPEIYRRQLAKGAELFVIVSAWPYPRVNAWRTLVRARAIENQAALVACNAAGKQSAHPYAGHSAVCDVWGERVAELDEKPGVLRAEIDLDAVREARQSFPALKDRVLGIEEPTYSA